MSEEMSSILIDEINDFGLKKCHLDKVKVMWGRSVRGLQTELLEWILIFYACLFVNFDWF